MTADGDKGTRQTQLDILTKYNDVSESVQHREHAELIVKMKRDEPLDDIEEERAEAYVFRVLNVWHAMHQAYEYGLLTRTQYETFCSDVPRTVEASPGFRRKAKRLLDRFPLAREFEIFRPVFAE